MLLLQVRYIIQGTEEVSYGSVAAWTQTQTEGTAGKGFHVLSGYADPIMAARLIEEATKDEGYVWVIPDGDDGSPGEVKLDGLLLIYGADIHSGGVRNMPSGVASPPPSLPAPVEAVDTPGDGDGPSPLSPATASRNLPPTGGGLIQAATSD